MAKKCPPGKYYCFDDKKCKKIPRGYRIGARGYLARDTKDDDSETKKNGNGSSNGNGNGGNGAGNGNGSACLLYTSPSPRDDVISRMPSSA